MGGPTMNGPADPYRSDEEQRKSMEGFAEWASVGDWDLPQDEKRREEQERVRRMILAQINGMPGVPAILNPTGLPKPLKGRRKLGQREIEFPDPPKSDPTKARVIDLPADRIASNLPAEAEEAIDEKDLPRALLDFRAPKIFNGIYRIKNTKTGEHRTFVIRTQPSDSRFAPGKRVVAAVDGAYDPFAFLSKNRISVWRRKKSISDKKTAYEYYALMLVGLILMPTESKWYERGYRISLDDKRCIRCNRKLTSEKSQEKGIGPICAVKVAEKPERVKKFLNYIGKGEESNDSRS